MKTKNIYTMKPMIKNRRTYGGYFPSLFDDMFNDFATGVSPRTDVPKVNVKESDTNYTVEFAAPGMAKDDFQIEVEDNTLIVSAEAKNEKKEENERFTRKEFSYHSFKRSFSLPENAINEDQIDATYTDGVLKILLPKLEEVKKETAKRIAVS